MSNTTGVAPVIHRLYPRLNDGQLKIIGHTYGPILGIAGPGAGKTLAMTLRAVNILVQSKVTPQGVVMCTFSKRAAQELRQRFLAVAEAASYRGDIDRVRISTIHSLCHHILQPHARRVGLRPGYRLINKEERTALMFECFDRIFGRDLPDLTRRGWRLPHAVVRNAIKVFDRIADKLIDPRDLIDGDSDFLAALGRCYSRYRHLLLDRNLVDFAHVQVWADQVLDHEGIANRVADRVGHLMCDEYQDTSYVQERLLMRLARNHGNICVVGDDDQSLYRFRGASVENILRFPHRFDDCTTAELTVNYRSHPDIVRAYDRWMATADWSNPDPRGSPFRYDKVITAHDPRRHHDYPAVIAVDGRGPSDEGRQLAGLLRFLKRQKVIATYDQVVVLLHSVEEEVGGPYLDHLCDAGIPARIVPAGAASRGGRARSEITITTIHQAKGLEWDVVIVGSLGLDNRDADPMGRLLAPYRRRPPFEPARRMAEFDHMRRHYVGFSRAKRLLVLTSGGVVHPRFDAIWNGLPRWDDLTGSELAALQRQHFRSKGDDDGRNPSSPRTQRSGRETLHLQRLDIHMSIGAG